MNKLFENRRGQAAFVIVFLLVLAIAVTIGIAFTNSDNSKTGDNGAGNQGQPQNPGSSQTSGQQVSPQELQTRVAEVKKSLEAIEVVAYYNNGVAQATIDLEKLGLQKSEKYLLRTDDDAVSTALTLENGDYPNFDGSKKPGLKVTASCSKLASAPLSPRIWLPNTRSTDFNYKATIDASTPTSPDKIGRIALTVVCPLTFVSSAQRKEILFQEAQFNAEALELLKQALETSKEKLQLASGLEGSPAYNVQKEFEVGDKAFLEDSDAYENRVNLLKTVIALMTASPIGKKLEKSPAMSLTRVREECDLGKIVYANDAFAELMKKELGNNGDYSQEIYWLKKIESSGGARANSIDYPNTCFQIRITAISFESIKASLDKAKIGYDREITQVLSEVTAKQASAPELAKIKDQLRTLKKILDSGDSAKGLVLKGFSPNNLKNALSNKPDAKIIAIEFPGKPAGVLAVGEATWNKFLDLLQKEPGCSALPTMFYAMILESTDESGNKKLSTEEDCELLNDALPGPGMMMRPISDPSKHFKDGAYKPASGPLSFLQAGKLIPGRSIGNIQAAADFYTDPLVGILTKSDEIVQKKKAQEAKDATGQPEIRPTAAEFGSVIQEIAGSYEKKGPAATDCQGSNQPFYCSHLGDKSRLSGPRIISAHDTYSLGAYLLSDETNQDAIKALQNIVTKKTALESKYKSILIDPYWTKPEYACYTVLGDNAITFGAYWFALKLPGYSQLGRLLTSIYFTATFVYGFASESVQTLELVASGKWNEISESERAQIKCSMAANAVFAGLMLRGVYQAKTKGAKLTPAGEQIGKDSAAMTEAEARNWKVYEISIPLPAGEYNARDAVKGGSFVDLPKPNEKTLRSPIWVRLNAAFEGALVLFEKEKLMQLAREEEGLSGTKQEARASSMTKTDAIFYYFQKWNSYAQQITDVNTKLGKRFWNGVLGQIYKEIGDAKLEGKVPEPEINYVVEPWSFGSSKVAFLVTFPDSVAEGGVRRIIIAFYHSNEPFESQLGELKAYEQFQQPGPRQYFTSKDPLYFVDEKGNKKVLLVMDFVGGLTGPGLTRATTSKSARMSFYRALGKADASLFDKEERGAFADPHKRNVIAEGEMRRDSSSSQAYFYTTKIWYIDPEGYMRGVDPGKQMVVRFYYPDAMTQVRIPRPYDNGDAQAVKWYLDGMFEQLKENARARTIKSKPELNPLNDAFKKLSQDEQVRRARILEFEAVNGARRFLLNALLELYYLELADKVRTWTNAGGANSGDLSRLVGDALILYTTRDANGVSRNYWLKTTLKNVEALREVAGYDGKIVVDAAKLKENPTSSIRNARLDKILGDIFSEKNLVMDYTLWIAEDGTKFVQSADGRYFDIRPNGPSLFVEIRDAADAKRRIEAKTAEMTKAGKRVYVINSEQSIDQVAFLSNSMEPLLYDRTMLKSDWENLVENRNFFVLAQSIPKAGMGTDPFNPAKLIGNTYEAIRTYFNGKPIEEAIGAREAVARRKAAATKLNKPIGQVTPADAAAITDAEVEKYLNQVTDAEIAAEVAAFTKFNQAELKRQNVKLTLANFYAAKISYESAQPSGYSPEGWALELSNIFDAVMDPSNKITP